MRLLFVLTFIITLCSCSDELLNENSFKNEIKNNNSLFSFNAITTQQNWKSFSILQKFNACQIPDSILSMLSTKELVELCATYPMNPLIYASDNPMDGARYVMKHFNGFTELQKRTDAAEKLLSFYDGINYLDVSDSPYPITIVGKDNKFYKGSNIAFIELVLASDEIPLLYQERFVKNLESISYNKFKEKLERIDIYGITDLSNTLLIQSNIALKSKMINDQERIAIQSFYNNCGKNSDLELVTKILFKL